VVSQANTLADLRGWSRFVAYQGEYSLASRAPERDILPMTQAMEMAFLPWGILEGGEITGKYNSATQSDELKRSMDTSERIKNIAMVIMDMAGESGHTPSQIAINWVRQKPYHIIPILGARSAKQLQDNLGCLDFELTAEQIECLNEASPIDLGFPHSFLGSDHVRGLIFGKTFSQIVAKRG
jgi:aryl-alcohol dehydrogenase-like predicted oxidoreductase